MERADVYLMKFGLLTIIGDAENNNTNHRRVVALCACGNKKIITLGSIKSGLTTSCGCKRSRVLSERSTTHGLRSHPLYKVLSNMKTRCYNAKSNDFENYGGNGVVVCKEWLEDFKSFYDFAINSGWKPGLQIDRINNEGDYEPGNCRFVTPKVNANNKKLINKLNTTGFRGVTKRGKGFTARVRISGEPFMTKSFPTALEAAKYRDFYCLTRGIETTLNFHKYRDVSGV